MKNELTAGDTVTILGPYQSDLRARGSDRWTGKSGVVIRRNSFPNKNWEIEVSIDGVRDGYWFSETRLEPTDASHRAA